MADTTRTVKVKFDGDAKGLARAANDGEREIDKFTKSVDKKYRKSGDDSGKGFLSGLKKWFSPKEFKKFGDEGGKVLGDGLAGAFKTPVVGPAIAAGLVGAVAVAAPAVGAVAASGMALAFGAGIAGLGITFAAKSPAVRNAWSKTLKGMSDDLTLLSEPFDDTLIHLAGTTRKTFRQFEPELDAAFKNLAPTISEFGDEVAAGIGKLTPAVRPLSEASSVVLRSLGPSLQGALGTTSKSLVKLADSVKAAPDGLSDLVDGAGDLVGTTLDLVTSLNDANKEIERITGGASGVDLVMGALNGTLGGTKLALDAITAPLGLVAKLTKPVGDGFHETATSADEAAKFSSYLTQGLDKNQLALMGITGAAPKTGGEVESLAEKFNRQWQATQRSNDALLRNSGLLQSAMGANLNYQEAVDNTTAAIKANGRTHDENTAKGRANQRALLDQADAANQQTVAMRSNGDGNVAAAKHAEDARKTFVKQAQQMGYSKTAAEQLAAKLIAIPNVTRTAKLQANITDLESKLKTAKAKLADKHLTATQRAKLQADIRNLEAGIATAKRALSSVPSSKTVTIKYTSNGIPRTFLPGSSTPGRSASGGPVQPRRTYLVGERGPELLTMPGTGGRITNAEHLRTGGAGGDGAPIVAEIHIEIGGEVQRVVRSEIKTSNRELKRTVMAGAR
ncbi:MAG TPA: hypothetical protein VFH76_25760 [Kribbella sp.]|nr:hypothetical protein [Kribbella sp.]